VTAALGIAMLLLSTDATALPRFASRTGMPCQSCHVNPTGGGMRTEFGRDYYARAVLAMKAGEGRSVSSGALTVGGDMRGALIAVDTQPRVDPSTDEPFQLPELTTAFLMQADVYGHAELSESVSAYVDYGVGSGSVEAFAIARAEPADAYVKAGSFVPPFGLKLPNHRTYIREEGLLFEPNLRETGVEVGAFPGNHSLALAVFNGSGSSLNDDRKFAMSSRLDGGLRTRAIKLTAGGSVWVQPGGDNAGGIDTRTLELRTGGYVLSTVGPFTYLGELDHRHHRDRGQDTLVRALAAYNELDLLATQGLDLQLLLEWFDPDMGLAPNTLTRVGGGFEFFPSPGLELRLLVRHSFGDVEIASQDPRTFFTAASAGTNEALFFVHVFL